jgi:hypothetical protein
MRAGGPLIAILTLGLALPALADDLKPICSDRPGHATSACTVEPGHVQIESALYDGLYQRRSGTTTDFTTAGGTVVKYGVSDSVDVEAGLSLFQDIRTHDASTSHQSGIGDLVLHAKYNPMAGGDGPFAMVLAPYLKLPTASGGTGNGAVEGGLLAPVAYTLDGGWSLFMTPEVDVLRDASGTASHVQLANDVSVGYALRDNLLLGADVYMTQSYDPGPKQNWYLFDMNMAWITDNDTQLDCGWAFGLNRATPDLELYFGVSRRF